MNVSMPYCSACGAKLETGEFFCANCGKGQKVGSTSAFDRQPTQSTRRKWLLFGVVGVVALAFIIGAIIFLSPPGISDPRYFTTISQIDISGANTYRVVTTGIANITRERIPEGVEYTYTPFEVAGIVAGQEESSLFGFTPVTFHFDAKTSTLTSDEALVTGLLDFINPHLQEAANERQPGDTWQVIMPISQDSEYMPESITVTFEMKTVSAPNGHKFQQVIYHSDTFAFDAFDEDGGHVRASFAGFSTIDLSDNTLIHASWSFQASRTMAGRRRDTFNHFIASYKSDSHGFPLVPFDMYDWKTPLERVEMAEITSDRNPPQWAAQAMGISQIAWINAELNSGQITNPLFAILVPIVGATVFADVVVEAVTDVFNGGPINDGFSIFKSGGREIGEWVGIGGNKGAYLGGGVRTAAGLATMGPIKLAKGAGITATGRMAEQAVRIGEVAEDVDKVLGALDFVLEGARKEIEPIQRPEPAPSPETVTADAPRMEWTRRKVNMDSNLKRKLNTFFSNFSEASVEPFARDEIDNKQLISFGIVHNWINRFDRFKDVGSDGHEVRLKAMYVEAAIDKYFGRKTKHQSVPQLRIRYRNGYYYWPAANGEAVIIFSQIVELVDIGNNLFEATVDVYHAYDWWGGDPHKTPEQWKRELDPDMVPERVARMFATIKKIYSDKGEGYILLEYLEAQ